MLIGVDIGGSHIGAGVVQHGSILKAVHKVFNAATASAEDLVNLVADLVKQVCDSSKDTGLSKKTLRAIGIGCPGQCKDGVLIAASNFPNVRNLNITSIISEKFDGVPCALFNDADAAMAAEIWCAGSTPLEHAAMITLGTGIGVSLVLNGALFQGASGLIEAGHMILAKDGRCCSCGQRGCAEAYSSATNTHTRFTEALSQQKSDDFAVIDMDGNEVTGAKSVFEKASAGNAIAISVLKETKEYLALLIINICRVVDPQVIIFGGGMTMAGDSFLDDIKKLVLQKTWKVLPTDVELRIARAVENGGILGAALAAEQRIKSIVKPTTGVSFAAASIAGFVAFCLGIAIGYHRSAS